ncbi:MAG TPA: hypothetical protein VE571_03460 [Solirubrobacteraceae bacterium]|nr:hypothetical protein [Solirubrobacteraceae bacterium]
MGFSLVLYANAAMQGAIRGTQTVLAGLRDAGSLAPVLDQLAPWAERQRLVRRDTYDDLEDRYRAERSGDEADPPSREADEVPQPHDDFRAFQPKAPAWRTPSR